MLAGDLEVGNQLLLQSGEIVAITKLEWVHLETPVKVYNFEVKDWHTYFVSELDVLVHNKAMWNDPTGGNLDDVMGAGKATKPMTWNEFQSANKALYDKQGMSNAWAKYKQANNIANGTTRSQAAKSTFLKELANSRKAPKWMNQWLRKGNVPPGFQVDHKVPLSIGGLDIPSNMRLIDEAFHKLHHSKGFFRPWE